MQRAINCALLSRLNACLWCLKRGRSAGTEIAGLLSMNSEEEFYDAETGEAADCWTLPSGGMDAWPPALTPQGWSRMTPVRSVLKMPWCLTARRRRTAAPRGRMECGSAGKEPLTRVCMHACMHALVAMHALVCRFSVCTLKPCIQCLWLDFVSWTLEPSNVATKVFRLVHFVFYSEKLFLAQAPDANRQTVCTADFEMLLYKCVPGSRCPPKWSPETISAFGAYWRNASAWWVRICFLAHLRGQNRGQTLYINAFLRD